MAIHPLPANIFDAGAVKLDSSPEVAMYGQLLQRQQAKKDALNQYYQKAISDVTPTGMRNQDITNGWNKKLNDLQEFAMNPDNKKNLENPRLDGYRTATRFNQMHSDLLADVQKSKDAAANEAKAYELQKEGKLALTGEQDPTTGNFTPKSDMDIIHRMGMSIYDPKRKDMLGKDPDIMDLSFTHQFTPLQETQMYNNASKGIPKSKVPDPTNQRTDANAGMIYTPYKKVFSVDQVKNIADNFANSVTPAAASHYESQMKDPANYANWTNAYQSVYGKTNPDGSANLLDTPQKAAKAVAILHANAETETGEDKTPDIVAKNNLTFQRQKQMAAIRNIYTLGQIDRRNTQALVDMAASDSNFDQVFNTMGTNLPAKLVDKVYQIPTQQGHKVQPPEITIVGDKYNFDYKDDKGNIIPAYHREVPIAVVKTQLKEDLHNAVKTKTTIPKTVPQNHKIVKIPGL